MVTVTRIAAATAALLLAGCGGQSPQAALPRRPPHSGNLLATGGGDRLNEGHTLAPVVALINSRFPGGTIQVRGHIDRTGTAAPNQSLSERRGATVSAYLTTNGTRATTVTAAGLASTQPLAEETTPDGSPSDPGRAFNRRVELAIRLP